VGKVNSIDHNAVSHVIEPIAAEYVSTKQPTSRRKPLAGVYMALLLFMFIYCARPEDWIPGLSNAPLAKFTVILAVLALVFSLRHIRQRLPREIIFLFLLIGQLFLAAVISPVWRDGAFQVTLEFAKVFLIVLVMTVAVNTSKRLRRLIFIQAASVAVIAVVDVWKGHLLLGRLNGILRGIYADPNDMALAIVISLPLCLALLFLTRNRAWKVLWAIFMLVMTFAVFLTGSRSGLLTLIVVATVCLWEFAIRGRRRYLLALVALVGVILWQFSSGMLVGRLNGTFNPQEDTAAAYGSAQQRLQLFWRSIEVTKEHLFFGVGPGNFDIVSGSWHTTHNSFTLMSSEGGVPALILYVLILWCGFKNLRAAEQFARSQPESRVLARALLASLVGFVVGSLFLSVAYQFFPYILVAYTTALFSIARASAIHSKRDKQSPQRITSVNFYSAIETIGVSPWR